MLFTETQVEALLEAWPRLRRKPCHRDGAWVLEGPVDFHLEPAGLPLIVDSYTLRLEIPFDDQDVLPNVFEIGGRIPRQTDEHVFEKTGALCLGSPLRLRLKLGRVPDLVRFVDETVIPFLYAASWRRQGGHGFPFDELAHGGQGLIDDYRDLLGLEDAQAIAEALQCLGSKPRLANKLPCPCACGRRLGRCPYRFSLNSLRPTANRRSFRDALAHYRKSISG